MLQGLQFSSCGPSDKLGQVGDFDVEITNVDVPRNLRQIDVFHSRHGPGRGCRKATLRRNGKGHETHAQCHLPNA